MGVLRSSLAFAGLTAALIVIGGLTAFGWRFVAPVAAHEAPAGACTEIIVSSDSFHTDLIVPASILPAEHPLRSLFPNARHLSVGWGDRDAYRFGNEQPWLHVLAILPPSPSLLHVGPDPPAGGQRLAISEEGVRGLRAFLDRAMRLDAQGRPIVVGDGYSGGVFIESPDEFHVFRLCNNWTAEALSSAGLPVSPFGAWTADSVKRQVSRSASCPRS